MLQSSAKLHIFDTATKNWQERGRGNIRFMTWDDENRNGMKKKNFVYMQFMYLRLNNLYSGKCSDMSREA